VLHGYVRALDGALEQVREQVGTSIDIWEDHSTWETAWVVESDYFSVRTTLGYGFGMEVARGLETMLEHFQSTLGTEFAPETPLPVFVLPDLAAYNTFGDEFGTEHSSFAGSFYADAHPERVVAAAHADNLTWLRMQITHSVVHQFLAAAYPDETIPTWIDEGLAAYFSLFWDYNWGLQEWARIRAEKVPLPRLLGDALPQYTRDAHDRFIQLGMLFHYLILFREDTRTTLPNEEEQRGPFRDYLVGLIRGETDVDSPVHAVMSQLEELDQALLGFEFPR
jgi:hypothetical protein